MRVCTLEAAIPYSNEYIFRPCMNFKPPPFLFGSWLCEFRGSVLTLGAMDQCQHSSFPLLRPTEIHLARIVYDWEAFLRSSTANSDLEKNIASMELGSQDFCRHALLHQARLTFAPRTGCSSISCPIKRSKSMLLSLPRGGRECLLWKSWRWKCGSLAEGSNG